MTKSFATLFLLVQFAAYSSAQLPPSGQKIYESKCKRCHGIDGTKGASGAKNLKISNMTSAEIKYIISNGKKPMPNYAKLKTTELDSLVTYVKELRRLN